MKTISAVKRKIRRSYPNKERVLESTAKEFRAGLTLREIADNTGLTISTIHRAENGLEIALTTALRLAKFFEKSVEEIWRPANGKAKR